MNRSILLGILIILVCVCTGPALAQPNIIHIVADDLGWTGLSTGATNKGNGSAFHQTPNIDQLATEGMAFTSAYATQTCVPTRVAMLTGQYATRTGVYSIQTIDGDVNDPLLGAANSRIIDTAATTIGETLQSAGYTTAHFGKFHVAQNTSQITTDHGYDFDFGGSTTGGPNSYFASAGQFDNTVGPGLDPYAASYTQAYVDANLKPFANGADVDSLVGTEKHLSDAMADAAIDFMQTHLAGGGDPFYMNVAFNAVHAPIESRPDLEAKYNGIIAANGGTSPDPRHDNAGYAGLLEGMDQAVGRIIAFLKDPNGDGNTADSIASNTVVMFYGDNGSGASTSDSPLRNGKGSQQEGGLRVPVIAWAPGRIAGGSITDEPIHSVDFYPTFADFAGAPLPTPGSHPLDGQSLNDLVTGQKTDLDRNAVYFHLPGYAGQDAPVSTVVLDAGSNRYKLQYYYENRQYEMYDLNADLGEANDLANGDMTVQEYELATRAASQLRNWLDDTGAVYPTVRADGSSVPPPSHLPAITFEMDASLHGLQSAQIEKLGITLNLQATGSGATFNADTTGVGVASSHDTGGASRRRRVNGTHSTPETIEFSFDENVFLKSLLLDAISTGGSEAVVVDFVSGDNPFTGLIGYGAADGFTLGGDSLTFVTSSASATEHLLEFGILGRDELFLTAGTVLSLTADPAEGGGLLLNAISVAQPLVAVPCDFDSDFLCNVADINLMFAQGDLVAGVSVAAGNRYDLNSDNSIDDTDINEWLRLAGAHNGYGDGDPNNSSAPFLRGDTDDLGSTFDPNDPSTRTVDITDFGNFLIGITGTCVNWECGNFDGDNDVDITDFSDNFLPNFVATGSGTYGSGQSIPEPSTVLLLGLGGALLLGLRSLHSVTRTITANL